MPQLLQSQFSVKALDNVYRLAMLGIIGSNPANWGFIYNIGDLFIAIRQQFAGS